MTLNKISVITFLTITIFIISLSITIAVQAQEDKIKVTLTIQVKTKDQNPLKDAIVKLYNSTTESVIEEKKTDSYGKASFSVDGKKSYNVTIYYPEGYKVDSKIIDVGDSDVTESIYVNVLSKWIIKVQGKGRSKDPVPSANVTIIFKYGDKIIYKGSKLTDENGETKFGPLPWETYEVLIKWKDIEEERSKRPDLEANEVKTYVVELPLYRVTLSIIDRKGSPVGSVEVELREGLDKSPTATVTSGSDGKAVMKLIPTNTKYYVIAKLKGITVYASSEKEIEVLNDDVSREIIVNAIKLNITIMDYDGKDVLRDYTFVSKLIKDDSEVGYAESENGVLRFGHTPFETYTLKITLGSLTVYSSPYEVKVETAEGAIKAWFYDIKIRVNASALVNASLTRSLMGEFRTSGLRFEFQVKDWEASVENVPKSDNYEASLFYAGKEVFKIKDRRISEENQVVWLNLTGYELKVTTVNLDGEPVSVDIVLALDGVGTITSFQTNEKGYGFSGRLLPLTYKLEAYLDGILIGEKTVDLTSDMSISLTLALKNIVFKVFDKDGEEALENVSLMLTHGKLSRNGRYVRSGTLIVENLPIAEYSMIVTYYGFKVLEDFVEISPEDEMLEFRAPGVLDLELIFLDSDRKPLDQGRAVVSFSGYKFESEIEKDGRVVFKNLPNVTLSIAAFYRDVELRLKPDEIELIRDDMKATITSSVHSFSAKILRGDGKPLNEGQALLYINDMLLETYNLAEENKITERLPEGDIKVEIKYRGRNAGFLNTYLEKSMSDLAIYSTIYPIEIIVRNPNGGMVSGARLTVEDEMGTIAEAVSGEDGILKLLLPAAESYKAALKIANETYNFEFGVERPKSISFLRPVPSDMGFELTIAASAINLAIAGYAISRLPHGRPRPKRKAKRIRRRVPRV